MFSNLQVYENIQEGFFFSITLKADVGNNALLQMFSLVESCFTEIKTLLPVTIASKTSEYFHNKYSLEVYLNPVKHLREMLLQK